MAETNGPAATAGVAGLGWEIPVRQPAPPGSAPVLSVEGFEGPLDWLLDLARSRRIDLARLSILALVEAFGTALAAALEGSDVRPDTLARWSRWLVMAAELTLLRSRLLAPADAAAAQDARDETDALRRLLVGRAQMAVAADWLDRRTQLGRDVFGRGRADGAAPGRAGRCGDVTTLLRACLAAIRLPADAASRYRAPGPPFWSVADAVARIRQVLPTLGAGGGDLAVFVPEVPAEAPERERRCRTAVATTFLGGLELARTGTALLAQTDAWRPIQIASPAPGSVGPAEDRSKPAGRDQERDQLPSAGLSLPGAGEA